jgi:hypothetical protein
MHKAMVDRFIEFAEHHAETIAEEWYKAIISSERTKSFRHLAKETCVRQAISFCKNIKNMYFAENCFETVASFLDGQGIIENYFARGVPLEEVIYSFILLRRHIWLQADLQALFNPVLIDMYQALESNNRVILVFDYATYITVQKYRQITANTNKMLTR